MVQAGLWGSCLPLAPSVLCHAGCYRLFHTHVCSVETTLRSLFLKNKNIFRLFSKKCWLTGTLQWISGLFHPIFQASLVSHTTSQSSWFPPLFHPAATCQLHGTAYHFPAETWLSQLVTFSITSCSGQCTLTPMQSASQAEQAIHPWLVGLILVLLSLWSACQNHRFCSFSQNYLPHDFQNWPWSAAALWVLHCEFYSLELELS